MEAYAGVNAFHGLPECALTAGYGFISEEFQGILTQASIAESTGECGLARTQTAFGAFLNGIEVHLEVIPHIALGGRVVEQSAEDAVKILGTDLAGEPERQSLLYQSRVFETSECAHIAV